jgi:hypothetical protein
MYLQKIKTYCKNIGLNLSHWNLDYDHITKDYSDSNECREIYYMHKSEPVTLYVLVENVQHQWEITEFSISQGD